MPSLNFTKRAIEAISPPESGQVLYRDTGLRGLGLRVGSRSKVFFVEGLGLRAPGRSRSNALADPLEIF